MYNVDMDFCRHLSYILIKMNQTDSSIYSKTGKGPDLILLHGWRNDRSIFDNIVPELAKNFTCWTIDLPGFGSNPRPKTSWDIKQYANYVNRFIDEHNIKSPSIVGHSFGGRVAIVLATLNSDIKKVVLYATPGVRQPLPRFTSMAQAMYRSLGRTTNILNKTMLMRRIRKSVQSEDYRQAQELKDIFISTINFDLAPYMEKLNQTVLLVWGEDDHVVPVKIAQSMQQIIPHSDIKIIPKGSHTAHLENPRLFCGLIRKYIND
ncbi:MAG: alpha/beta hydrolase [Patescibacteria group bacterium]|jgi:pimeloyl-ACP methyl ester carboxylesterase